MSRVRLASRLDHVEPFDIDAASSRQGFGEEPDDDAALGVIDLITIQSAYAANMDALKAMHGFLEDIPIDANGSSPCCH